MKKMYWLDMEMTGLIPTTDRILEAAVVVTDLDFQIIDQYETAVFQPENLLEGMDDWCKKTHSKSGLTERVKSGISEEALDEALFGLAQKHFVAEKEKVILCGNSISQDRAFVERYLPAFAKTLHYRILDVSSFKIVFENIYQKKFAKKNSHRALADIEESIAELKFYLEFLDPSKLIKKPESILT